jgi:hypothetical protein
MTTGRINQVTTFRTQFTKILERISDKACARLLEAYSNSKEFLLSSLRLGSYLNDCRNTYRKGFHRIHSLHYYKFFVIKLITNNLQSYCLLYNSSSQSQRKLKTDNLFLSLQRTRVTITKSCLHFARPN